MQRKQKLPRLLIISDKTNKAILRALEGAKFNFIELAFQDLDNLDQTLLNQPQAVILHYKGSFTNSIKRLIQAGKNRFPVILVINPGLEDEAQELIEAGAYDYLFEDRLKKLPLLLTRIIQSKEEGEILPARVSQLFLDYGSEALVVLHPDGTTGYISPSFKSILGFSNKAVGLLNFYSLVHEEDRRIIEREVEVCLELKDYKVRGLPVRVKKKSGEYCWLEVNFINFIHNEAVKGILISGNDVTCYKMAEIEARENEIKYRSIFENSVDGILLTVPNGQILAANPSACSIFQMTEAELCKAGRAGIIDIEDISHSIAIEERDRTGKVKTEVMMKRKDGSKFPAEITSSFFLTPGGEKRTSMIIRDISESKIAEEQLKASKESYKYLFENSPLPNVIYDVNNFEILNANQAAVRYYNYSLEEFLKLTVLNFLPKEEIFKLKNFLRQRRTDSGELVQNQMIHLKRGAAPITVETYGYPVVYKGRDSRMVTCLDISEREAILQKLTEKSEDLQAAQKIAKLGYWSLDLDKCELYWSDEIFNIWERDKEDFTVSLEALENTIHPEDLEQFKLVNNQALKGEAELNLEHRIITPTGAIKWVCERGKIIKDNQGRTVLKGTVQDITEHKETLEKLIQIESRQRGILQSQTNYLIRTDLEGKYTYCNDKFRKDFSWIFPDNEIIGKNGNETVHERHHQRVVEAVMHCMLHPNTVYQLEIDKLQEDGEAKTTLWDFICLTDAAGQPAEIQCVGIDVTDRVRAQKSLEESNLRNELVIKATSDAIYDWDLPTNNLFWGEPFYSMFGYLKEERTSCINFWLDNLHPEDSDRIKESLEKALAGTENHWEAQYRFKTAQGNFASVIEKGFILRDNYNKAVRMVGAIQNITEKKKLEELLDQAYSLARIGSFEIDCEKNSLYWSEVTREIHEVDEDYHPDLETGILFYKEGTSRNTMKRSFQRALEENKPYDLELQIVTAKGNVRWVRKIGRPTFLNGKCLRINGSFQDITHIKNSELAAIKASEEKQTILESIGDAFFAVDSNWVITYWNNRCEDLLACSKEESIGKNLWDIIPEAINTDFYKNFQKATRENSIEEFEEYLERSGSWLGVTAYPSKNGLSVYFRDVTSRRKAELKLRELNRNLQNYTQELVTANKGLEQFSYIVSHNLRAPVANIIGLGDLIKDNYSPEVKQKLQEELLANVEKLDVIIKDLNDILQVKTNMSEKKEAINLNDLVETIKTGIAQVLDREEVEIITDFSEVPYISSIRTYLHSIFHNLIFNSIKYRRPEISPRITISSHRSEGKVVLTFKDNGMGINLAKKGNQVFGLYKRFHNHVEGKGMGLFMVKTQVELMGGEIDLKSEENKGTEFIIEFFETSDRNELQNDEAAAVYSS